jgi:hypothetical protein
VPPAAADHDSFGKNLAIAALLLLMLEAITTDLVSPSA